MSTSRRAMGVYQPRSRRAAFAEAIASFKAAIAAAVGRALHRGGGLLLLCLTVGLMAALASYNSADPSFDVATSHQAANWLGPIGAHVAAMLLRVVGIAALALALPLGAWGWQLAKGKPVTQYGWRIAAMILGLAFLGAGLGVLPASDSLPAGWGGLAGTLIAFLTDKVVSAFDIAVFYPLFPLIFAVLGSALIILSSGIAFRSVWTGAKSVGLVVGNVGASTAAVAKRLNFRRPAQTAKNDEDIEDDDDEEDDDDDSDDEEDGYGPDLSVAPEPLLPRDKLRGQRVRREDRRPKIKLKPANQPVLNLGEGEYQLPPLGLLTEPPSDTSLPNVSDDALEENARLLESVLSDFGVRGRIVAVRPGPVVTLYELEPAAGVKSSRVISLSDDIARSMSAVAARVAVIPGRNVIGIELPNHRRETVYLRELLSAPDYEKARAPLTLALGKTIGGEPVMADLAKMPHLLIAGTTGSGKSVGLNTMILSLLYRMPPEQCRMIMIDPKMLELSVYDEIPHLLAPVVIDPKKAVVALKWAVREMEQRYGKMAKIGVRGVEAFNERVKKAKEKGEVMKRTVQTGFDRETGRPVYEDEVLELEAMPYIVIVVDEMADLMMISGKEIEGAVQRLAQMARAAGIHLIAATQRPSVDVITGTIKANFPTRISFQVTSKIDSRTILGEQGAEQLLGQGDMLYMMAGGRIRRVHGPFVTDSEVEEIVRFLKTQGRPEYLDAVTEEPEEEGDDPYALLGAEGGDDLFDKAVAIVARERKVSTSYIQRRLQIGYNRAARLIEKMEEEGMISKPNHQGKREILLPEG